MYGAEADDSMTARRDCLGSIDMNDGIVRRPRSKDVRPLMGMEWRMKSTVFYLDMTPVLAIDPSHSRDGFG